MSRQLQLALSSARLSAAAAHSLVDSHATKINFVILSLTRLASSSAAVRSNCNSSSAAVTATRRTQILARQLLPLLAVAALPLALRSSHTAAAAAMSSDNTQIATLAGE